jgi:hypothetical protein
MSRSSANQESSIRSWRWRVAGLALVSAAALLGEARPATAAAVPGDGWTTDVSTVSTAAPGETVTLTVTVTADRSQRALVDLEIWDRVPGSNYTWQRPLQQYWDNEQFVAGTTRTFTVEWVVPDDEPLNDHVVRVGIFGAGWTGLYDWNDRTSVISVRAGAASTTTQPPPPVTTGTTTTEPSTTTTEPSTTSTSSTTTSTTSTTSTTTPAPPSGPSAPGSPGVPSGSQFLATFDSSGDFFDRFNIDVGNYAWPGHRVPDLIVQHPEVFTPLQTFGDHNMGCEGPTTTRTLDNTSPDWSQYFWWCAPGGDASKGHVMTGFDTTGYAVVAFSPKQTFNNVTKVCWDINATDEGGGKWTQMLIVPEALYQQFAPRLDYVTADSNGDGGPGDFNIQAGDHPGTSVWGLKDFRGTQELFSGANVLWKDDGSFVTADKAARYRHCLEETSPSTSRLTIDRANGTTSTFDLPSAIPDGPARVVFQDEMYDPPKRGGYNPNNVTWHWDNIAIS